MQVSFLLTLTTSKFGLSFATLQWTMWEVMFYVHLFMSLDNMWIIDSIELHHLQFTHCKLLNTEDTNYSLSLLYSVLWTVIAMSPSLQLHCSVDTMQCWSRIRICMSFCAYISWQMRMTFYYYWYIVHQQTDNTQC